MRQFFLVMLWLLAVAEIPGKAAANDVTPQCSSIRELVYAGWTNQFSDIRGDQLRSSNGFSEKPLWRFTNTRYDCDLKWPGSTASFLEDYDEETDSVVLRNWQFIAEMGNMPDILTAQSMLQKLNKQIEGCPYLHNDSLRSEFRPLPHDSLPATCPADLQLASLYELPLHDRNDQQFHRLSIMTGIDRHKQSFRVSLIIEDRRYVRKLAIDR